MPEREQFTLELAAVREGVDQRSEHGSVRAVQPRPGVGSAKDRDLMTEDKQLDIL